MRIWLINPYGALPNEGWREYRFATIGRILAGAGCDVTWWTAGFAHHSKVHRSRKCEEIPVLPNFRVGLVPTPGYRQHIGPGRLLSEFVFACRLFGRARHVGPVDVIIASDSSQASALAAAGLARRFGATLILDVMDLWPELFELAFPRALRPTVRPFFWPFRASRRWVRRRARGVTALCPSYLHHALREARPGVESRVMYNGIEVGEFRTKALCRREEVEALVGRPKADGETWAVFAGTLGNNYDIECLVAAAGILKDDIPPIHILVAGDGPLRSRVTNGIERGLDNLHFLGKLDHAVLGSLYQYCDVGLCAYSRDSNVGMPDKAYDYLAAGLPLVSSLQGDLQELMDRRGVGLSYDAGDSVSLAEVLRKLARDSSLRQQLSANASACSLEFEPSAQYGWLVELIRRNGALATRRLGVEDVGEVVAIHVKAFPTFFLSFLGPRFLTELYSAVALDDTGILFGCFRGDRLLGFVAGSSQPASFYRRLIKRRWWRFAVASLLPVVQRPSIVPRLLRGLKKPSDSRQRVNCAELMSVAVAPEEQGLGGGKMLVAAFLAEAERQGTQAVYLTTDRIDNESTNVFYARLGFHHARTLVTPEGRSMNEYEIALPTAKAAAASQ